MDVCSSSILELPTATVWLSANRLLAVSICSNAFGKNRAAALGLVSNLHAINCTTNVLQMQHRVRPNY